VVIITTIITIIIMRVTARSSGVGAGERYRGLGWRGR
jgi:hypothetical protein